MSNWMVPYNKLDNQQREFVDNHKYTSNTWISGFPGSGKSVLLAHSIRSIKAANPDAKVALVVFTRSLIEMFRRGLAEVGVSGVSVMTMYDFNKGSERYDYVLADEIQDFPPSIVRELRSRSQHVVAAGDANQSIYESDPQFHETPVTPSQTTSLLSANQFELTTIHRLTRSIMASVASLIPAMRSLFSAKNDATKKDVTIRVGRAANEDQEVGKVLDEAVRYCNSGQSVGILFASQADAIRFCNRALSRKGRSEWSADSNKNRWGRPDFDSLNEHMAGAGLNLHYVGNGYGSFAKSGKIFVMTYHSAKGIDFDSVFLPFCDSSMQASRNRDIDKTVFMVAVTRSKENLFVSYTGRPHSYLDSFGGNRTDWDMSASGGSGMTSFGGGFGNISF